MVPPEERDLSMPTPESTEEVVIRYFEDASL